MFILDSLESFLLVLIGLFARCYGWGATSEYWFCRSNRSSLPQNFR